MKKKIICLTAVIFASMNLVACSELSELKDTYSRLGHRLSSEAKSVDAETVDELIDEAKAKKEEAEGILSSTEDIGLTDVDGKGVNYTFTYNGETFEAKYTTDNWKIIDSYKISNIADTVIICQALIDEHPIHGRDMESYRTADDMAYEWLQHNIAYEILPDDNDLKAHSKDVDLDPADQGKDFDEIYEDRTGKKFSLDDFKFN